MPLLLLACLALAALSLLMVSAPTYDPWSWIIWGREITQWDLVTTDGPSWKPLPVLFTTPFSLFGDDAAPGAVAGGRPRRRTAGVRDGLPARRAAGRAVGGRRSPPCALAAGGRVHLQLRARQLRGDAGRARAVGGRAAPRRPLLAGLPARLRRRAAAARGVAVLGPVRALAALPGAGPAHRAARVRQRRACARAVVPARVLGLGRLAARRRRARATRTPTRPRSPTRRSWRCSRARRRSSRSRSTWAP